MGQLREKLVNAGFRRETAPVVFKGMQLILAGVGLFIGGVFGVLADGLSQGLMMKAAGGIVVGFMVPKFAAWTNWPNGARRRSSWVCPTRWT